jgi:hypothetical protein
MHISLLLLHALSISYAHYHIVSAPAEKKIAEMIAILTCNIGFTCGKE